MPSYGGQTVRKYGAYDRVTPIPVLFNTPFPSKIENPEKIAKIPLFSVASIARQDRLTADNA